ncbi:methyl-accepting chemotaxis protein [Alsobacter metallidurans]|uniref:Methyl-accepting chemotaxis protein n=2 Tax=Alsobacter metallidurans TaxID=340221 RepID=A0A917I5A9_9HYPH|nr:methyl-accepting chemotaxis protein [Alsobacter metallidurans]
MNRFFARENSIEKAIDRSQAMIEFDLSGKILQANENFLRVMGYTIDEIVGKHHSMFAEAVYRDSSEYKQFWAKLNCGEFDAGQYRRIAKGGRGVWLQASYMPVLDPSGKPTKVVKLASEITAQVNRARDMEGKLAAIDRVQAVIEFGLDGEVITANQNFFDVVGYSLDEIKGKHHSMFVDPAERSSPSYQQFWDKLRRGETDAAQYRRLGKGGREIWIQASYNPVFDADGKPCKIVKFATDITEQIRSIQSIERAAAAVVEATRNKDLTTRMECTDATGPMKSLADGVNELLDTFAGVVDQVRNSARTASTASAEIATGNHELAARTEQQAASLEQTAATTEELAASVKATASASKQAREAAQGASEVADAGGNIVRQAVDAMARIEQASRKISDITGVIDEIAFQTNLLALNAAVEAARAGEAGKGFAVVASEVRTLAQRSSEAAKDITGLISASGAEVAEGVKLVRKAGETLETIVQATQSVAATVTEISTAASEQSNGIDEMSQAVAHMDQITQQNAEMADQSAAAAEALNKQVRELRETVETYQTGSSCRQDDFAPAPRQPSGRRLSTAA